MTVTFHFKMLPNFLNSELSRYNLISTPMLSFFPNQQLAIQTGNHRNADLCQSFLLNQHFRRTVQECCLASLQREQPHKAPLTRACLDQGMLEDFNSSGSSTGTVASTMPKLFTFILTTLIVAFIFLNEVIEQKMFGFRFSIQLFFFNQVEDLIILVHHSGGSYVHRRG